MSTKLMRQVGGQQQIIDLLYEQIAVEEFQDVELQSIQSLFIATDHALTIFNVSPFTLLLDYH